MGAARTTLVLLPLLVACAGGASDPGGPAERADWAIAIHGGAGGVPKSTGPEELARYREGLRAALEQGRKMLDDGASSLDVVERVIRTLEDDPQFNAGKGAVFNHVGGNELDASIMDGRTLAAGAVAGVTTVRNPISLARLVMERTRHLLLGHAGAERFADEMGVERVDPAYFFTERRWKALQRALEREGTAAEQGTVGVVALDREGNLAAGTSTGGLTNKRFGRIGDSPVIGAGTYADNRTCAVSGTGVGEEFIRHGVAQGIARRMQWKDESVEAAAAAFVNETLKPGDGGVIAVDHRGRIAMVFNTASMFRGAADSNGRFEIGIGSESEPTH